MFRGLNPALQQQAPQGLQMNWQPNIGGEAQMDSGQTGEGLGSAADMLRQWPATRRKGIAAPHTTADNAHGAPNVFNAGVHEWR